MAQQIASKSGCMTRMVRLPMVLRGTVRWPTFLPFAAGTPRANRVQTPDVRHHFRYRAAAAYNNFAFDPGQITFDDRHLGSPIPDIRVYCFPKPAAFAPANRADLDAAIEQAKQDGTLRTTQASVLGEYLLRNVPLGELVLAVEAPFKIVSPTTPDRRLTQAAAPAWHIVLKLESKYELVSIPGGIGAGGIGAGGDGAEGGGTPPDAEALGVRGEVTLDGAPWNGILYTLPFLDPDHAETLREAIDMLGRSFGIRDRGFLEARIRATPMLDLWAIFWADHIGERRAADWVRYTLFEHPNGDVGLGADQLLYGFRPAESGTEPRPVLPYVPLDDEFIRLCQAESIRQNKPRAWYWGRFPIRQTPAPIEGGDVTELKARLILWGDQAQWVDIRHGRFDAALQQALVRFKHFRQLTFHGQTISAVVDQPTYLALDQAVPGFGLAAVASQSDPNRPGETVFPEHGFDRILHFAMKNGNDRLRPAQVIHITSGFRCLDHNRNVYLGLGRLRWRLASNHAQGIPGANGAAHAAGAQVTAQTVVWGAERGTYQGGAGDTWAPDYSDHIQGLGVDFRFGQNTPAATTLLDWQSFRTTGASAGHAAGRIWLEPMNIGAPANRIHLDTGDLPEDDRQYALTDDERNGPRFTDTVLISGQIRDNLGSPVPYALIQLSGGGIQGVREFSADATGRYVAYGLGTQFPGPYTLSVLSQVWDVQTVADQVPREGEAVSRVRRAHPRVTTLEVEVAEPGAPVTQDVEVTLPIIDEPINRGFQIV